MTNAEKFVEVFGTDPKRQYATKSWWDQEFVPPKTGHSRMVESAYDKCPICVNRNKNCQFGSSDCHFEEQIMEDE